MAEQNGGDVARGMKSEGHSWAAASSGIDKKHHRKAATADEGTIGEGTTEEALSVEDTNRLREKLGLAPLNRSAGNDVPARGAEQLDAKKDEHRIAREKKFQEKEAQQLSERVSEQREVRRMRETLRNTRGIADQEDNDADADVNAFVRKQKQAERRQKEDEKHKAERTAQMLAERAHFDEEAALSEHARKESSNDIARDGNVLPTGIGVQHRADEIAEGQEMEMTLEDSHILNEKGELNENGASVSLQNVKLSEERKRARARQAAARTQSGKRVEDPFSADAGDEERLLPQYDDEVEGALADGERMHIDSSGTLKQNETDENKDRGHPGEQDGDATENGKLEVGKRLHERLKNVREESATFSSRDLGQQREYYTKEEMAQFATRNKTKQGKKKQHKKNLRKSKLTAEELEQIAAEEQQQKQREGHEHSEDGADVDVRARNREAQQAQAAESKIADELRRREAFERAKEREAENTRQKIGSAPREKSRRAETEGQHGATGDADDEEQDHDLGRALERSQRTLETITTPSAQQSVFASRSSAQNRRHRRAADIAAKVAEQSKQKAEREGDDESGNKVVLSDTGEFVRGITTDIGSELPTVEAHNDTEQGDAAMGEVSERADPSKGEGENEEEVKPDVLNTEGKIEPDEHLKALKPEVDTSKGVAGALQLLEHTNNAQATESYQLAGRPNEKKGESLRMMREAAEIDPGGFEGRKFNFSINQYDEFGRLLTPKEAFRRMCWRFHGMPPGKSRQEKRLREIREEKQLQGMAQGDTPTGSMSRVNEVQREQASPYVVLSGKVNPGQASDAATGYSYAEKEENTALQNAQAAAAAAAAAAGNGAGAENTGGRTSDVYRQSEAHEAQGDEKEVRAMEGGQSKKVEFNLGGKRKAGGSAAPGEQRNAKRARATVWMQEGEDEDE